MNALTTQEPVSAQTLEHVLGTGDLSKLTTQQRVEYYGHVCRSLGLNPLTRPFRFLALNGQIQLYATKDCTDQLRSVRGITLHLVEKQFDGDLYIVTARARSKDGREDEDIGAVLLPRSGESRANALMKGTTKAKRRVTLSICGLGGMVDESELDTMPGAITFNAEDEVPDARDEINASIPMTKSVPLNRAAAADMPRAPRVSEKTERTDEQWKVWVDKLRQACAVLYSQEEFEEIGRRPSVGDAIEKGPQWVQRDVDEILADTGRRLAKRASAEPPAEELPDVEIAGADKLAG